MDNPASSTYVDFSDQFAANRVVFEAEEIPRIAQVTSLCTYEIGRIWTNFERFIKEERFPVPSGLAKLDEMLGGGFMPGQVHVIAAPPGAMKTSWAISIADRYAATGGQALIWSRELPATMTMARLVSQHTGAPWGKVLRGQCGDDVSAAGEALRGRPLHVYDGADLEVAETLTCQLAAKSTPKVPALLVVDYLQLLASSDKDLRRGVEDASAWVVALAKTTGVCILAISSTARSSYGLGHGKLEIEQVLGIGRESGRLEFDAASVIGLIPLKEDDEGGRLRKAHLVLAKDRLGQRGRLLVELDGLAGLVRECAPEEMPTSSSGMSDQDLEVEILRLTREQTITSIDGYAKRITAQRQRVYGIVKIMLADGRLQQAGRGAFTCR